MSKLQKRVDEINALINRAIADEVSAIECDSTWESVYEFAPVQLQKRRIRVVYKEWNGIAVEGRADNYSFRDTEAINYVFSWIRRCIRKGYKESERYAMAEALEAERI